jgi:beta-glucanase (GH16 family)
LDFFEILTSVCRTPSGEARAARLGAAPPAQKTKMAPRVTPTHSGHGRAGNEIGGVLLLAAFASALPGCGSNEDLVLGSNDFVLERRDDFDEIDFEYWELASHTFDPNLAWFSPANAKAEGGQLVLSITQEATPAMPAADQMPKPYAAAELRTRVSFLYGRFRARARLAPGVGIVSAFWGFYDRYDMGSGDPIDNQIVTEGANTPDHTLRYAISVPTGAPQPTEVVPGFDLSSEFHELGFDWTPDEVRFYLDGELQSAVSGDAATGLRQYERLVLSAYPTSAAWTGAFDPTVLPVTAAFDWVEIYSYGVARP